MLVPRTDLYGNDAAGIRSIELRVPLATYLPWHLRTGVPAGADHLMSFTGHVHSVPAHRSRAHGERRHAARASSGST